MGYVILGHGGFSPADGAKMEVCALNAGTTLQFYADTGQSLVVTKQLLDDFASMSQPWPPIDSTGVTYNLSLEPLTSAQKASLVSSDQTWGGHTLLLVDQLACSPQLCTGDETTCPKDPRMITSQVAGPTEHGCDGILAHYGGQDLHWIACTVTEGFDSTTQGAVDTARGDAPSDAWLGQNPDDAVANALQELQSDPAGFATWFDKLAQGEKDVLLQDPGIYAWDQGRKGDAAATDASNWVPTEQDISYVTEGNRSYVKEGAEDFDHPWEIGGALVLLGNEHDPSFHSWVQSCPDYTSGTFEIKRATFGAGKIVFSGVPGPLQGTVESMVEGFSDKKVSFE